MEQKTKHDNKHDLTVFMSVFLQNRLVHASAVYVFQWEWASIVAKCILTMEVPFLAGVCLTSF